MLTTVQPWALASSRPLSSRPIRLAIVGPFAFGVGMVNIETEASSGTGGSPLQHSQVTVRLSESRDGPATDKLMNAHGLPVLVVDELDFREFYKNRFAVTQIEFHLAGAADDLLWRNAIDPLGEDTHEIYPSTGNDKSLESVGAQICEQNKADVDPDLLTLALGVGVKLAR